MGKKNHNKKTVHKMHFKKMRKTLSEISSIRQSVAGAADKPVQMSTPVKPVPTGLDPKSLPPKEK